MVRSEPSHTPYQLTIQDVLHGALTDEKARIVKVRDDILDAMRYAYMMRRYAVRYADVKNPPVEEDFYVPSSSSW